MMKLVVVLLTLSFTLGEEIANFEQIVEDSSPFVREKRQMMGYGHPGYGSYGHGQYGMYDQYNGMNQGHHGLNHMYHQGGMRGGMMNHQYVDSLNALGSMMDHGGRVAQNFQKQMIPPLANEAHAAAYALPQNADPYLSAYPFMTTYDQEKSAEPIVNYILTAPYREGFKRRHYEPMHY